MIVRILLLAAFLTAIPIVLGWSSLVALIRHRCRKDTTP